MNSKKAHSRHKIIEIQTGNQYTFLAALLW